MPSTLNEFLENALKNKPKVNEADYKPSYKYQFTEDKDLWKVIKKYWPKEAKQLEKGYDEQLMTTLRESAAGSISRYGLGTVWKK